MISSGKLQKIDFNRGFTGGPEVKRTLTESLISSGRSQEIDFDRGFTGGRF